MAKTENMMVAETILGQMGGAGRLKAMVNGRDFVAIESGLQFKFSMCSKVNTCRIILDRAADHYTVEFWKITPRKCDKVVEHLGAYAEDLQRLFKYTTGLDTHL